MANFSARSRTNEKKKIKKSKKIHLEGKRGKKPIKPVIPREERKPRWEKKERASSPVIVCPGKRDSRLAQALATHKACGRKPENCLGCNGCSKMGLPSPLEV